MDRIPGGTGYVSGGSVLAVSVFPPLMYLQSSLPCSVSRALLFTVGAGDTVSSHVSSDRQLTASTVTGH